MTDAVSQGMSMRGSNTSKGGKVKVSSRLKGFSPNSGRNTQHEGHAKRLVEQPIGMWMSQHTR